jgi:hypothetical protein
VSAACGPPRAALDAGDARPGRRRRRACRGCGAGREPGPAAQVDPLGGGRISVEGRAATVYGYSQAFGQAPHDVSAALVRRCYPLLDVAVSWEGY